MSHTGLNNWTPAIYSKTHRVNWTAERNKSYNWREKQTAKQIKRNNAVLMTAK